jgi:hypothetical protein
MKKIKLKNTIALGLTGLGLAVGSANAAVFVDFGNQQSDDSQQASAGTVSNISATSAFTTGSFTTTGGPITFELVTTTFSGNLTGQDKGWSVTDGSTSNAIDNSNSASGPFETMTFTISEFTGLGAGETLEILGVSVLFATDTESYTINGGSDTFFTLDSTGSNPAEFISVSGTAFTIGAGSSGDTKFAIDGITVGVVAVPEPSSAALLGLAGLALMLRRRR